MAVGPGRASLSFRESVDQFRWHQVVRTFVFKNVWTRFSLRNVSSLTMTRERAIQRREKLAAQLSSPTGVLRGSLLQRTLPHSSGCLQCARGEGPPLWVLTGGIPAEKRAQSACVPTRFRRFARRSQTIGVSNGAGRPSANGIHASCV